MNYTTTIPAGKIAEEDLIALVDQVKVITKADVSIEQQFVIVTDDVNISSMLDSMMDAIADQPAAKKNGKVKVAKKSAKNNSGMTSHQVRFNATGELVSTQAFNKDLKAGLIAELTSITNAKGEEFVVMEGKLVKGPQS